MFWRTKLLYNAIAAWASRTTQISNRVDLERLECLSPIDRYVVCSRVSDNQALTPILLTKPLSIGPLPQHLIRL
jgi:hypothetical protein